MTKLVMIGAIVSALGLSAAAEQPQLGGQPDQRAEAPTYGQGGSWVFKVKRFTLTHSSADQIGKGGEFALVLGRARLEVFSLEDGKQIPVTRPRQLALLLPTARVRQNESKHYEFPLFVGKKWDGKFGTSPYLAARNEVTAIENVTTPAGTFRAYKIERLYAIHMTSGDIRRIWWTSYYSPETRSLVKFQFERNTLLKGPFENIDAELISFAPDKNGSPAGDRDRKSAEPTNG